LLDKINQNFSEETNLYFLTLTINTTLEDKKFTAFNNKPCFMKNYAYDRKKCNLEIDYKSKTNNFKGFNHTFTKIDLETAKRLASRSNYNKNNPNNPTDHLGVYDLAEEFIQKIIKI
jgi:hypothetical protein